MCIFDDCGRPAKTKKMCSRHYRNWVNAGGTTNGAKCKLDGCTRPAASKKHMLCAWHRELEVKKGDPLWQGPGIVRAKEGDRYVMKSGYVKVKVPDNPHNGGWILEHRHVMEQMLGRPLLPGENVHHKNGDRLDNRSENLELWITRQPTGQRVEDMVVWAREIIERYDNA